jgi:hypothetical protein
MSATTFNDFYIDYKLEITQAVNNMVKKYLPLTYCDNQVEKVGEVIRMWSCGGEEYKELKKDYYGKSYWFLKMKSVVKDIKEAGKRKCNDCEKMWCDCRNTCIKPKSNPRPIEFPQDVFNVIKDYLGVYDIPEPITELMDMMKIGNLGDGCIDPSIVSIVSIKDRKSLGVDGRLKLFKSKVVWDTKNPEYPESEKNDFLLKIANKYPQLNFGKELTDNNKIFLMDLLFTNNYEGTEDQGLKTYASLFDFMRGECGLSKFKKTPKKPRPYVMYFERDYYGEEYAVKNFAYDMRDFYNSMDKSDLKTMRYACNHLL